MYKLNTTCKNSYGIHFDLYIVCIIVYIRNMLFIELIIYGTYYVYGIMIYVVCLVYLIMDIVQNK